MKVPDMSMVATGRVTVWPALMPGPEHMSGTCAEPSQGLLLSWSPENEGLGQPVRFGSDAFDEAPHGKVEMTSKADRARDGRRAPAPTDDGGARTVITEHLAVVACDADHRVRGIALAFDLGQYQT